MSGWFAESIAAKERKLAAAEAQLAAVSAARDGSDERTHAWLDLCELRDELSADLSDLRSSAHEFEETDGRTRSHTEAFYEDGSGAEA